MQWKGWRGGAWCEVEAAIRLTDDLQAHSAAVHVVDVHRVVGAVLRSQLSDGEGCSGDVQDGVI